MNPALGSAIFLTSVNLLTGNIGDLSAPFRNCLALLLWLSVLVPIVAPYFRAAPWRRRIVGLVIFGLLTIGFRAGNLHGLFALFLTLWIPNFLTDEPARRNAYLTLLQLAAVFIGLWTLAVESFPQAFALLERFSNLTSSLSSALSGQPIQFGATYSGIPIFLTLAFLHLAAFAIGRPRSVRLLTAVLCGQFMLVLVCQLALHRLMAYWAPGSGWLVLGVPQWMLLLPGCGLAALHLHYLVLKPIRPKLGLMPLTWVAVASVLLFVSLGQALGLVLERASQPRVLLYDDGTLDWSVPVYGRYTGMQGGMFGSLVTFLQRRQCQAARGPLTNAALERANVLVVFNLMHKFTAAEKQQIWDFVGRGGSLLAVGDHTGTTQIREPFNDLLEPVHISFNFDCAMPIRPAWANGMRWFPHCLTRNLNCEADTEIHVGASLSVAAPAQPLIIGTHAWSDKGELQNRTNGCLGDRRFSTDERLGDVVLVATAPYKKGKVLVFGDTTTFQNGALARAAAFVQTVFGWLSLNEHSSLQPLAIVLFAGAAVIAAWSLRKSRASLLGASTGLFICLYFSSATTEIIGRPLARSHRLQPANGEALLDISHLSRCNPELWDADGLGGLVQNLMRKEYCPVIASQFSPDLLQRSRLVFLVAPAQAFSPPELDAYVEFVRQGGELFICAGYEESSGCQGLLDRFGLGLRNLPLGLLTPDSNDAKIYFLNAWPVRALSDECQVLCRRGEYPLIVGRRVGRGRVVLIGDSGFLLNRNLEMPEAFNSENIEFFRKLVPAHGS